MPIARPLRFVQQGAQPFSCPLCKSIHAAYIFGTGHLRIFCCSGCTLTFSQRVGPATKGPAASERETIVSFARGERDHAGLTAAIDRARINGPVLLVARPADSLIK